MEQLLWLSIWVFAGVPFATMFAARRVFSRRKQDYAYYLEWKGIPKWRIVFGKAASSIVVGGICTLASLFTDRMVIALSVYLVCSLVVESTLFIGRPHPTPQYRPDRYVCEKCRAHRDNECENVRMLDGFEAEFKSPKGKFRPICCCGFRLSEWRQLVV